MRLYSLASAAATAIAVTSATGAAIGTSATPILRADPTVIDSVPRGGGAALTPIATMGSAALRQVSLAALAAATPRPQMARPVAPERRPAPSPARVEPAMRTVSMSVGTGQLIHLPRPINGVFVADDRTADVQVKSATDIYLFAKAGGQTTVYATDKAGAVVWSSNVRVGANIADVGGMLRVAMPEAQIVATPVSGMVLLTGLVLAPADAEEAQRLTEAFVGQGVQVLNHLKVATPQQVALHVKIAEVSRSITRNIGLNILNRGSGNPVFGIAQGAAGEISTNVTGTVDAASGATPGSTIFKMAQGALGTTLGIGGRLLGSDILATLNLAEQHGLVSTLAEPTLVALSGETASFLAGGEIPIPQSQGLGTVSVEFKQYGVSLAFTPTILSAGRISLHVRPEVSQLSDSGSVRLNGFTIPALTTRRVDTTIELGSGQSFVIGGLLQNTHNNSTDKAPVLGDLPILGALFRSNSFRKQETELVVVVTPYIVKPVDANRVALPTDGYRAPVTVDRMLTNRETSSVTGARRPTPGPAATPAPVRP